MAKKKVSTTQNIAIESKEFQSSKIAFNLANVLTSQQTSAYIQKGREAQVTANEAYQYACIGSAYQVIAHGNTNQIKELLENMSAKTQRYQKIHQYLNKLTGGMVEITEEGVGKEKKTVVKYTYSEEKKVSLIGDTTADDWSLDSTTFHKLSQSPWWDEQVKGGESYFEIEKFKASQKKSLIKGFLEGVSLSEIEALVTEAHAEAKTKLEEEAEKKAEETKKAEEAAAKAIEAKKKADAAIKKADALAKKAAAAEEAAKKAQEEKDALEKQLSEANAENLVPNPQDILASLTNKCLEANDFSSLAAGNSILQSYLAGNMSKQDANDQLVVLLNA